MREQLGIERHALGDGAKIIGQQIPGLRRRSASLIGVNALETSTVGAVHDIDRPQALDDLCRHAEGTPGDGAAVARGHRAVGGRRRWSSCRHRP